MFIVVVLLFIAFLHYVMDYLSSVRIGYLFILTSTLHLAEGSSKRSETENSLPEVALDTCYSTDVFLDTGKLRVCSGGSVTSAKSYHDDE